MNVMRLGVALSTLNELNFGMMTTYEMLKETFSNRTDNFWWIDDSGRGSIFHRTGLSAVEPIGYAKEIQAMLDRDSVKIYGFLTWDNPEASICRELNIEGHDFAVVFNRYLIDPWLTNVASTPALFKPHVHTVYDLDDPVSGAHARYVYGPREKWELNRE